jgi:UDP-GlcNAc:undecaprenyl-phosphate GlcNAc-1-phosphate transferase
MELILPLLVAFTISYIGIWLSKPIAVKLGLVDTPNSRKLHMGSVPLVGGLAIFFGVLTSTSIFMLNNQYLNIYLVASALVVFIGVLDDFYDLPVRPRIVAQVIAACFMIYGANISVLNLGDLFGLGVVSLGVFSSIFTVIAVVASINAFNMVDGIDGLVGMLSLVTFIALTYLLYVADHNWFLLSLAFIAATIAYLIFNLGWVKHKRKKVFMGDAGSMLIGFSILWLLVVGSQGSAPAFKPITALWLVSVPVMDMAAIMVRRIKKGQSPFKPDRDHLHHIFLRAGLSSKQTLIFITLIALGLTFLGIFLEYLDTPDWLMLSIFLFIFISYSYAINHIWRFLTLYRRLRLKGYKVE